MTPAAFAFWHLMAWVWSLAAAGHSCEAVTQSTHSTPATANAVVYGGNCVDAFRVWLYAPGHWIAWVISS